MKEEKIQCNPKKDIASIIIGDPKGRRKFIIEKIAGGCGKKDDSNPFALEQEREFNEFIKLYILILNIGIFGRRLFFYNIKKE
ncbi:hypothetical protein C4N20_06765 [Fusobacterium ulcerans]|uniref:Uncharacterized protein n=1 Tax=Fusobacterium ulcerans TaxID=861 RepID=A0AAX2JGG3_9FUSO|nr:hypothetical protein [Fusobacterium ulcerans]AVQ27787.1 hypothetical protein C4N20_06765 [Fusobacterium ulcerans]EFS27563.1 hypothetical protein FUAG_03078 [Fusobacterium ulcerans ATCC 49185]SQJ16790.1 Uncharacterised protein [Fusobacterium ulcerans]